MYFIVAFVVAVVVCVGLCVLAVRVAGKADDDLHDESVQPTPHEKADLRRQGWRIVR